jgi:ABC-2 type transport system ATP-binding protein
MPKSDNIIEVKHFKISFAEKAVIKDLTFNVKRGEIFGLLGSNGSGKTTTIRTLLNLYQADKGSLTINGKPFQPDDGTRIGYLPEERGLYKKESVFDVMMYFARLRNLENPKEWIMNYLKRVGLEEFAKTKINKLSQGMQQKVQLGITIMNDPELLILDEPTKGFDPVNRRLLLEIIEELHQKGCTIILITHYMDEVERLCDNILLLKDGVARAYGSVKDVRKEFNNKSLDQIFVDVYGENDAEELGEKHE